LSKLALSTLQASNRLLGKHTVMLRACLSQFTPSFEAFKQRWLDVAIQAALFVGNRRWR